MDLLDLGVPFWGPYNRIRVFESLYGGSPIYGNCRLAIKVSDVKPKA